MSIEPADIISLRKKSELTRQEAADLIGVNKQCWQEWEAGKLKMHPFIYQLFDLAANERLGEPREFDCRELIRSLTEEKKLMREEILSLYTEKNIKRAFKSRG